MPVYYVHTQYTAITKSKLKICTNKNYEKNLNRPLAFIYSHIKQQGNLGKQYKFLLLKLNMINLLIPSSCKGISNWNKSTWYHTM